MAEITELKTDRLVMRPLKRSDAAALYPTLSDEVQCLYLSRPAFVFQDEQRGWITEP